MGNYYLMFGDTLNALKQYDMAIKVGTDKPVAKIFIDYYRKKGDERLVKYYEKKLKEAHERKKSNLKNNAKQDWFR
jgi:hypothetical protein